MRVFIAVVLAATPAVAEAKVEIRDVRAAHGMLGPERKSSEYVSGDQVYVRYTLAGFRTDANGRMRVELRLTVTDAAGKQVLRRDTPLNQTAALGGDSLPGFASFDLGDDVPPGDYEMKVEVTDLISKEMAAFRHKFACKKVEFALVQVRLFHDAAGEAPAPAGGLVSQTLHVKMKAVGFDRSKGEIDVEMEIVVLDAAGKPVMPRPFRTGVHNEKPEEVKQITNIRLSSALALNRSGNFTLRITVVDKLAKKSVVFETPLRVAAP
jgi:hypothetical protein